MKQNNLLWIIGSFILFSFFITSCDESAGVENPYDNWEEKNKVYFDSIASVAVKNMGDEPGQWKRLKSRKLASDNPGLSDEYVYAQIREVGNGVSPEYDSDTIVVHYRGTLITGYVFDKTFDGELDRETDVPTDVLTLGGVVDGWSVALDAMKVGDRWDLYIPAAMGYGIGNREGIPGSSTLIFDINLVDVRPMKGSGK